MEKKSSKNKALSFTKTVSTENSTTQSHEIDKNGNFVRFFTAANGWKLSARDSFRREKLNTSRPFSVRIHTIFMQLCHFSAVNLSFSRPNIVFLVRI